MAINKILTNSVAADAISEEHLDVTAITGHAELSAVAADNDVLLVYDTSAGTLKKIQSSNVGTTPPTFSSVSPTSLLTGDGTGNHTIVVTGKTFDATATFKLRTDGGTDIGMDSVVRNSPTQLTGTVAKNKANLTTANEPFDIIITNGNGLAVTSNNQINVDASPVYVTASGTLGTRAGGTAMATIDVVASDPESAGNVTFEIQSGSLPAGVSSATVHENGVSKFRITGTPTNPGGSTTSNFVLRAVDAASNTTSRAFAITVTRTTTYQSFTASGTFSVPSGVSNIEEVLVVAGGGSGGNNHGAGGGAGGLVFMPDYAVTPGGTVSVTIGCGGAAPANFPGTPNGQTGAVGQDSVFGTLTAKGGGLGGANAAGTGGTGGSGGGGSGAGAGGGGPAIQTTQSDDSGAYGFGNAGGVGVQCGPKYLGGGGGGAGASGSGGVSSPCTKGGPGGVGRAYTISDGTTSVYYAGGGGGGAHIHNAGAGGQGGGGDGGYENSPGANRNAQANKGGGGGGVDRGGNATGGAGGKGIVIVKY